MSKDEIFIIVEEKWCGPQPILTDEPVTLYTTLSNPKHCYSGKLVTRIIKVCKTSEVAHSLIKSGQKVMVYKVEE